MINEYDVIIVGAGAAGLMCAIEAGKRGRRVLVIDHANKPGKKILMAGGGRCNFTNLYTEPANFISNNPHFHKSALARYTQWDFIEKVKQHNIAFHEKTLGQLFCDNKSKEILNMLLKQCEENKVTIKLDTSINSIESTKLGNLGFDIATHDEKLTCQSVVIATGGLSIPTIGSSPFAYKIAEQFNIPIIPTHAGLVPFTLHEHDLNRFETLSGISAHVIISNQRMSFEENILFTHRGLSGPAVLQISSYWNAGETLTINLLPNIDLVELFITCQRQHPQAKLKTVLNDYLAKRLVEIWLPKELSDRNLADISHQSFKDIAQSFQAWQVKPNGTEGYRTAEVTLGGIDCNALSSKTMEVKQTKGLYFIGEAVDITGWLGGYNFQWAWSSGFVAGQVC